MFIIVEGPDGAGKTTFIKELTLELWKQGRGTVLINPKRSPNQSPLIEYKTRLDFYRPRTGVDLILDRCWYSDDVYGPIWRGSGLEPNVRRQLEDWALKLGAVVALLDQPDEILLERVLGDRLESDLASDAQYMTEQLVAKYAAEYRHQRHHWELERLDDPSIYEVINVAAFAENRAPARGRK